MKSDEVDNGTNYKQILNSRNLNIVPDKHYWNNGKIRVVDAKGGAYIKARINGTILLDVSDIIDSQPRNDKRGKR